MPEDRLPTVSAAQALDELDGNASRQVSTSLPDLDRALTGNASGLSTENDKKGGIQKSQVTEIWGPPGVGKTTFGIQAAANVLRDGKNVVWIGPSTSVKRLQVLQYVVGALQKLAATRDAAVVVLTQCATRMQAERRATLTPAINANVWEQGITTRVALFRDWMWHDGHASGARLAAVQKVNGKATLDALETVYGFKIESTGLVPTIQASKSRIAKMRTMDGKRKTPAFCQECLRNGKEAKMSYSDNILKPMTKATLTIPNSNPTIPLARSSELHCRTAG
ncbi:hypothetical protein SLS53_000622 [Cytospora paraplurivora]|uniref:RecA family profile 1 domain-containing protein n=1 Tax=Cytospora paraplurivora TaxID=2898453 RepID=A0AAN9UKI9_9PEZI